MRNNSKAAGIKVVERELLILKPLWRTTPLARRRTPVAAFWKGGVKQRRQGA